MGAAGFSLCTSASATESPVFIAVARFADAVDSTVVSSKVTDYISPDADQVRQATATAVGKVNEDIAKIANGEFSDLSESKVYELEDERTYFFYPAKSRDGSNAALVFFDTAKPDNSQLIAVIAGPTLFGIGKFAEEFANELSNDANPREKIRRKLLPRKKTRPFCPCPINASYPEPDTYTTEEGEVSVNYKIENGKRIVTVKPPGGTSAPEKIYELHGS
jgi:hypothetical protein